MHRPVKRSENHKERDQRVSWADWLEMQDNLAALSRNSIHRVVDRATHNSLLCDKGDSQVTSAAI